MWHWHSRIGLGTPIGVSALTDRGIEQIFDAIARDVDLSDALWRNPRASDARRHRRQSCNAGKARQNLTRSSTKATPIVIVQRSPHDLGDSVTDVRFDKDEGRSSSSTPPARAQEAHMVTNDIEFYSSTALRCPSAARMSSCFCSMAPRRFPNPTRNWRSTSPMNSRPSSSSSTNGIRCWVTCASSTWPTRRTKADPRRRADGSSSSTTA